MITEWKSLLSRTTQKIRKSYGKQLIRGAVVVGGIFTVYRIMKAQYQQLKRKFEADRERAGMCACTINTWLTMQNGAAL